MNMKRIISILLTAAIVLGLMATGISAALAATEIDTVELGGVTLTLGEALPDTATTGEYGTVTSVSWEKWDYTTNEWVAVTGNVENGNAYRLNARVEANEGYSFESSCDYIVGGEEFSYARGDGTYVEVEHAFPVGLALVDEVTFATLPAIEPGVDAEAALARLTVAADAPYQVSEAEWRILEGYVTSSHTGAFEAGKIYILSVELVPKPGYWLNDPDVNSEQEHHNGQDTEDGSAWVDLKYRLTTPIEKVELTLEGVEVGKAISDVKVTLPDGVNYVLDYVSVYDRNWNDVTGNIEKDLYELDLRLVPADGYHFADDLEVTLDGQPCEDFYGYPDWCYVEYSVDFAEAITKVDLPAIPQVKAGDAIPAPTEITPEGANYSYSITWAVYTADGMDDPGTAFEDGKVYAAMVVVTAGKGYKFTDDTVVTVEGKSSSGYRYTDKEEVYMIRFVALGDAKLVSNITVSGPAPTADKAPGEVTGSGKGYTVTDAYWGVSKDDSLDNIDYPGEVFQVGEYVYLGIEVKLEDGYVVDPFGTVTFNGKSYDMIEYFTYMDGDFFQTAICLGQLKEAATPNTGDETPVLGLVLVTVASVLGMGLVIVRRKTF